MNLKLFYIFYIFFIFFACSESSFVTDKGEIIEIESSCSYIQSDLGSKVEVFDQITKYNTIISSVLDLVGIPDSDIKIRLTDRFGAFAVIEKNCGGRFFLYNQTFFDSVSLVSNSINGIKSICFHEIAHQFYHHPLKSVWNSKFYEKQADRYSGYQMRLIGCSLEESLMVINHFADEKPSHSHPEKNSRLDEIKKGYIDASLRIFKDSSLLEMSNLLFAEELILSFEKLTKNKTLFTEKSLANFKNDSFILEVAVISAYKSPSSLIKEISINPSFIEILKEGQKIKPEFKVFKNSTYSILGELIVANDKGELLDLETKQIIGKIITPSEESPYKFLKIESARYLIENDIIYSTAPNGTTIQVGKKIN